MVDTSTIPVTIGLDVLETLIEIAQAQAHMKPDWRITLRMANNAASEARAAHEPSIPYETEGMSEIRRLLTADGVADHKINHFKGCLSLLEQHDFKLMRTINEEAFAGVTINTALAPKEPTEADIEREALPYTFAKPAEPKEEEDIASWRVVCIDNFNREHISDRWISNHPSEIEARTEAGTLNATAGEHSSNYYTVYEPGKKLYVFEP